MSSTNKKSLCEQNIEKKFFLQKKIKTIANSKFKVILFNKILYVQKFK